MAPSEASYEAIRTRDARFDGRLFVGVKTTGIYCRPVCPAKPPLRQNCLFFPSAAEAELAGFRPCLRCRPELAPGRSMVDAPRRLARLALRRIEDDGLFGTTLEELAEKLGVTSRHLRRTVTEEYGVTPVDLLQTRRLLLAKQLLTDTRMPLTEVAFASGFGSVRRFNALLKSRYRLSPGQLRRSSGAKDRSEEAFHFELGFRPPYDFEGVLGYLKARAVAGVESVTEGRYARTVRLNGHSGWLSVERGTGNRLSVCVAHSLGAAAAAVLARVRWLFDLNADAAAIHGHLQRDALFRGAPAGLRVPGCFDGFEILLRAIAGQQISVAGAGTLLSRLAAAAGQAAETPFPALTRHYPSAAAVASFGSIRDVGFTGKRAETIRAAARAVAEGAVELRPGADPDRARNTLLALPGVGPWTVEYVLMRALAWPDAFPAGDLGIRKALGGVSPKEAEERSEAWRPWRAYAAVALWRTLSTKAKEPR